MNYVAIDPSLSCTAVVVNDNKFVYTTPTVAQTKKGEPKRWFLECDGLVQDRIFKEPKSDGTYSENEMNKMFHYSWIVTNIIRDIKANIDHDDALTIAIEGYSYSSSAGPLIDLVTFSTLLRDALFSSFPQALSSAGGHFNFRIYQPTEVKQRAAMLTYPAIPKNKAQTKFEYRNFDGVAGGSFKKPEIYKALIENENLKDDPWVKFLIEHQDEILELKNIPKPIEDVNDAKILYEIIKSPQPLG